MSRRGIEQTEWYNGHLAIGDVVFVSNLNKLASHQPDDTYSQLQPREKFRLVDQDGDICIAVIEQLFEVAQEEVETYWQAVDIDRPSERVFV